MSSRLRALAAACAAAAIGAALLAASASAAFPGTNGKIAFAHDPGPGPNTGIFTIDPNGQNQATLLDPPEYNDFQPSYSADGEKVVFARVATPPGGGTSELWVMNQDGSNVTQLTQGTAGGGDTEAQFSPDGARIVFERRTGGSGTAQLWIMNADGSNATQLTSAGIIHPHDPTFSPDGTKIAFSYGDPSNSGFHGIGTINVDGSGFTPLTTSDNATIDDYAPDYSPDGNRIAFMRFTGSGPDIYVMGANGSNPTAVTTGPEEDVDPVFSPDGTRIAFEQGGDGPPATFSNIVTADPNAVNQITRVTNYVAPEFGFQPTWQPLNPPDCTLTGTKKSTSFSRIQVTVNCPDENATAVFTGSGKAAVPKGAVISKKKKFKVQRKTVEVPAATPLKVNLKVSKKGKKALKKAAKAGKKGKVKVTATLTDNLGETATEKLKITFVP